ncbi:MAG TPA: 4-(cytidine 5'-diphospho)-2-C-methyl-D-erythritol kinase [Candidatus Binatia bacterium]
MRIRAPAKVNLSLRVVGRRRDGYHLIDSVMVPVGLCDELEITRDKTGRGRGLRVTCDDPEAPEGRENLAYRAAELLLGPGAAAAPIHIHIKKRIPVGAGLGGGSSDAAAALLGLDRLLGLKKSRRRLLALAARLGADVPFFISGRPARARGVGERLRPIRSLPRLWVVVLYPGFGVSTAWAYRSLSFKLTKSIENTSINRLAYNRSGMARLMVNDLEKAVFRRYPRVASLKERLVDAGAAGALMSGSGSSVFGIFFSGGAAKQAYFRLSKEDGIRAFLTHSLNRTIR